MSAAEPGGAARAPRFVLAVLVAGVGVAVGLTLLALQARAMLGVGDLGEAEDIGALGEVAQNSLVYDSHGNLLAVLHAEENRSPVALNQVPQHVVSAIIDVEDDRFWSHGGVNLSSTVRALVTNVQAGEVRQGGSTITQQLVKNALLTPDKNIGRKVREAVLAMRLEDEMSKREILERYLNIVYFGNGAYGVQAAAETYFNSRVEHLTIGQASLLAGIIRNPVGYDPIRRPEAAAARRSFALERMVALGDLTAQQAERIRREPLPTQLFTPLPPPNDYFVEEVKQRLLDDERLGETPQERYNALFRGGLRIHTTLDSRLQRLAEEQRAKVLTQRVTRGEFTSALATVEPATGYVRALVAGDDFGTAKYNLATQGKRQPGSSFKIIVLLAALDAGFSINDTIDGNSPCTIKVAGFAPYTPGNYEGSGGGTMSLTDATARSINCAYARLGPIVGLERVRDMAARLGIPKDRIDPFPSMALGAEEVTPLEMAAAYAAIANDGVYHPPTFVQKVTDRRGDVVFEGRNRGSRAVSAQTARQAIEVMQTVVERGTGTAARLGRRQVAGKTGTSQNHENAWFVGFTPQLSTSVWMGSPVGNVPMLNVGGRKVTGGSYPATIWGRFMAAALDDEPAVPFTAPDPKLIAKGKLIREKGSKDTPVRRAATTTTSPPSSEADADEPAVPTVPAAPAPSIPVISSPPPVVDSATTGPPPSAAPSP
ncbi:MAG TPA: PBP1A family penicillin-binding protein [Acidimicrobiales bacterium]|nr:PBP1A family penicillin-binding protein [Acidimicrobiales bacterium]